MGYTLTLASVIRNKEQLEQLFSVRTTLEFRTDNPAKLAHKLREAIAAAKEFPEFAHFGDLKYMYKFTVSDHGGSLIARFIGNDASGVPVEQVFLTSSIPPNATPVQVVHQPPPKLHAPTKKVFPESETLIEVLQNVLRFPNEHEIFFPNAMLDYDEKERLFDWTKEKSIWKFIDHGEGGITLTKRDVPEEILWQPLS